MNDPREEIIRTLEMQKEIFGDSLFSQREDFENKGRDVVKITKISEPSLGFSGEESFRSAQSIDELNSLICNCLKCPLGKGRNKFVFGTGDPQARVMVIGEGPGADEDAQGEPFVGRAGKLLTDILKAIKFERSEVFIANIVKCRPPGNRTPASEEIDECFPYLEKQIELINPKLILLLGATAVFGLLKKKESLGSFRGKVFYYGQAKVMVTYHPAALLRNPEWKRATWEDVQAFRKLYDEIFPE